VAAISASGRFVVSGGALGSLAVQQLDLTSGLVEAELSVPAAHDGPITCIALAHTELKSGMPKSGGGLGTGYDGYGGYGPVAGLEAVPSAHGGGGAAQGGFDDVVLSGGADCTARLWKLRLVDARKGGSATLSRRPWKVLRGHAGPVECGALSAELGVALTCAGPAALLHAFDGHDGVLRRFVAAPRGDPTSFGTLRHCALGAGIGLVALYFTVRSGGGIEHVVQVHSVNGGCLAEAALGSPVQSLAFVAGGGVLSLSLGDATLQLLRATDLEPLSSLDLRSPTAAFSAAPAAPGRSGASATAAAAMPPPPPALGSSAGASGASASERAAGAAEREWLSAAGCVDWAPDPSRPGMVGWGDGSGRVVLVGLPDAEEWARHMPIWHHRGGLRQAVHSVGTGLRSKTGRLASSTKAAAAGAMSEAKYLAKDVQGSAIVRGVLGFFGSSGAK